MKVNKFSRMYLVGMICILQISFYDTGCRDFEAGVSFIESEKAGNTI